MVSERGYGRYKGGPLEITNEHSDLLAPVQVIDGAAAVSALDPTALVSRRQEVGVVLVRHYVRDMVSSTAAHGYLFQYDTACNLRQQHWLCDIGIICIKLILACDLVQHGTTVSAKKTCAKSAAFGSVVVFGTMRTCTTSIDSLGSRVSKP